MKTKWQAAVDAVAADTGCSGAAERDKWFGSLAALGNRAQLHVAFVLRTVPPYRVPFLTAFSNASAAVRVTVVTADALNEDGKLVTVPTSPGFDLVKIKGMQCQFWQYTLIWMRGCRKALHNLDCDVIVLEGSFGILSHLPVALWARWHRKGVIVWVSGWNKPTVTGLARRFRDVYLRGIVKLGDHFVCYSKAAATWVTALGVPSARVNVGQNTIDVEAIAAMRPASRGGAARLRIDLGIEEAPVIVYVGALTHEKRVERLIWLHRALRQRGVPVHTVIVGDGPAAQELSSAARMLRGVHMVGRVVDEVDVYFALGDVFVLPGLGGLAINQAMANGLPVLCGEADGTERDLIIEGITGYCRPVFALEEWTELIYALISDPDRRHRMGAAAVSHVLEHATLGAMCDAFADGMQRSLERCIARTGPTAT